MLHAYDIDEINPLGIEIWYRTTRDVLILDGISRPPKNIALDTNDINDKLHFTIFSHRKQYCKL